MTNSSNPVEIIDQLKAIVGAQNYIMNPGKVL
jgi:hypothetical protein